MLFQPTKLADAYVIDLQKHEDERGFLSRVNLAPCVCQRARGVAVVGSIERDAGADLLEATGP